MGNPLQALTDAEICEINRILVTTFGGLYTETDLNLHNPDSLYYIVDAIQGSLFGEEIHPGIFRKAAALCWQIITHHVFHDGNKRTGMEVCRVFLEMNGYALRMDVGVIGMALWIAEGKLTLEDLTGWVEECSIPIES